MSTGSIRSAEIVVLIKTVSSAGRGTEEEPNYFKTEYWSFDGQLVAVGKA